ncbi:MAG: hemolysin [Acidimicrobiaceae bacterium]|nr:hemolysin [Acidimicrobiaceae bacterium]
MELLILYIFLTISLSFLCSILEAVLLSINTTFIKIELKEGKKYAKNLLDLKNSIDEPLIIILTLNTIAHTVGAILVGVQAKVAYSELNLKNTFFASGISDEFLVGFVSTVMTIMILLFSEIIPKTIGAKYWNKLAKFTTVFLYSIIPIFKYTGILWILQAFTKSIGASKKELFLKREDISTIAEIAKEEGIIEEKDSKFIKNIVKLRNVSVKEIMTPYSVMVTADENLTINEFYKKNPELIFSRIPILNNKKIEAYVLKDTILESIINEKGGFKLKDIKRPIIISAENTKIPKLFDKLLKKREHISLVIDSSKNTIGIVTLEDVIETILGYEIVDETDMVDDMQLLAKKISSNSDNDI